MFKQHSQTSTLVGSLTLLQTDGSLYQVSTHLASSLLHPGKCSERLCPKWSPPPWIVMTCKCKPRLTLLSQGCVWGFSVPTSPPTCKHYFTSLQLLRHTYDMAVVRGGGKARHQFRKTKKDSGRGNGNIQVLTDCDAQMENMFITEKQCLIFAIYIHT